MYKFILAIAVSGLSLVSVWAQVKSGAANGQPRELVGSGGLPGASRVRVLGDAKGPTEAGSTRSYAGTLVTNASSKMAAPTWGDAPAKSSTNPAEMKSLAGGSVAASPVATGSPISPSQIYRVGVGDVLDVRLVDLPTTKSTLFTVQEGGAIEYPLAGDPVRVAGLTAEEIAAGLRARIKVLENPRVVVKIRDYASHSVIVTGLVSDPGARFLRREAMPLYVLLSEARPRPEAVRATVLRPGQPAINLELKDERAAAMLVMAGDLIKVSGPPAETEGYFYVGGAINSPGQKTFHSGLTLTQAILASGGVTRAAGNKVKVSRQGADGRLIATEYNLRQIDDGKAPDPILQRGDRLAVSEAR